MMVQVNVTMTIEVDDEQVRRLLRVPERAVAYEVREPVRPASLASIAASGELKHGELVDIDYETGGGDPRWYRRVPVLSIVLAQSLVHRRDYLRIEDPVTGEPRSLSWARCSNVFVYRMKGVE